MNKANKTRQYIIEKTAPVFNTKGYAVTSLSDIVHVTGLTKGSVYGNFRDKDEVTIEAFKYNVNRLKSGLHAAIAEQQTPYTQLMAMVSFYRNSFSKIMEEGGCPMLNAATESDDNLLFLKQSVQESFVGWNNLVSRLIQAGIADGSFKRDIQAAQYASTFMMLIEGGLLMAKTLSDGQAFSVALDRIVKIIKEELKN